MSTYIVTSPLNIPVSKSSFFSLNLNKYRNTHFHVLSKAKNEYFLFILNQVKNLPKFKTITIRYTLYPKTKRMTDLDNVLSIHAKFFQDCLTKNGNIEDEIKPKSGNRNK